ncbi:MAG: peptidoglycan DD-metalloendopeptidase family protein [Hyphomicrobiales bacterium]|nr:peptidoglycan DD-metalloendopeptidase family protein [Hyphomicrobiales bacterium]
MRALPLLLCLALAAPAFAEQAPAQPDAVESKKRELQGLEQTIGLSLTERARLESEIKSIAADRAKLAAALTGAARAVGQADQTLTKTEDRLNAFTARENDIRASLSARRATIAQVLGALQRMGRRTPPALLVRPEDMLEAVRAAMLLGAVMPGLRAQTEKLAADLQELVDLRRQIAQEKENQTTQRAALETERIRLSLLVDARQTALGSAQAALEIEQRKAADLARAATSLKDLISRMEAESEAARKAAEAARKADEDRKQRAEQETAEQQAKIAASPFRDPARLAPALSFAQMKQRLPLPAEGDIVKTYGDPDGLGGVEKGLKIALRPQAPVAAPSDGWVMFAAPYRTYGKLLILNAGDGYYILLAGLDRINVDVGQFVLAGEPVGAMGQAQAQASALASTAAVGDMRPVLYVEFRKDGAPIDPGPWWAKIDTKRVRG